MMMRPAIAPLISDSIGRRVIKANMKTSKVGKTDTKPKSLTIAATLFVGFSVGSVDRKDLV